MACSQLRVSRLCDHFRVMLLREGGGQVQDGTSCCTELEVTSRPCMQLQQRGVLCVVRNDMRGSAELLDCLQRGASCAPILELSRSWWCSQTPFRRLGMVSIDTV